jgi:adenylate cyclase, class 2
MAYEVEMKFQATDQARLEVRLTDLGSTIGDPQTEVDVYFAHPARDFAKTDEALRIRRKGSANYITYKGPKIDATTKTRHEIDLPLPPSQQAAEAWTGLLEALGFVAVGEVRKSRRKAHIDWQGRNVEVSLDEINQLGAYVELELIAEADGLDAARANIASLAQALGLEGSERRSYRLHIPGQLISSRIRSRIYRIVDRRI